MPKSMYEMDEKELQVFVSQQEHNVAKLNHERPGSSEYRFETDILKDAKQLLAEKRKNKEASDEVRF
jgi:hypothetical protein